MTSNKPTMDRSEFLRRVDECLERVADWLEPFDPDEIDFACPDGVVTLEFADGTKYVLNRQIATNQMWFAAGVRAWHYDWDEGTETWRCDKDGHELLERISEVVTEKLGREVRIPA
jgi:CyaY protein